MAKGKKDKVPAPGKFPKTKKVEKDCKGKWATWLKTKATIDFLPGRMIEWDGAMVLAKTLEKNNVVTSMDMSHNNIGDDGMKYLAQAFKTNITLRVLSVSTNGIGDGGGLALASVLATNRSLTSINLLGNELTCISAQALGNSLRLNSEVCQLNLSWNKIGHRGARALATAMEYNHFINIELGGQQSLGDEGIQSLCEAHKKYGLKDVHTSLAWWHNDIGKAGGKAIADLLQDNEIVLDVNVAWNSIGSDGVEKISQALTAGKTVLRSINLANNIIGDSGAKEFASVLSMSIPTLEKVNLSHNNIGDVGATAIANACAQNTALKHLDMSSNKVGVEGAKAYVAMVKANKHMMTVQLQKNRLTDDAKTALSEAMRGTESETRDARSTVPTAIRVNYGAADDENALLALFNKTA